MAERENLCIFDKNVKTSADSIEHIIEVPQKIELPTL